MVDPRPVLVVEDDSIIRSVAGMSLKALGRPVLYAENGHEALALARTENPAVIVLDYVLPLMDGTETLRRLKQDARTADIPVVIMSANTQVANGVYDAFEGAACIVCSKKPCNPRPRDEPHPFFVHHGGCLRLGDCQERSLPEGGGTASEAVGERVWLQFNMCAEHCEWSLAGRAPQLVLLCARSCEVAFPLFALAEMAAEGGDKSSGFPPLADADREA
jgi:CheY-like chemotaxis protein